MASVRSNLAQIRLELGKFREVFNLTVQRHGRSLGERALDLIARHIQQRSLAEQKDPQGVPWAKNKEPYASSPAKEGKDVGVLSGDMLSWAQMQGTRQIDPKSAAWTYGTTEEAQQKAEWFQEGFEGRDSKGREQNRPAREFATEIDEETERDLDRLFLGEADQFLRDLGADPI